MATPTVDVAFIGADKVRLIDNDRRVQRFVPDLAIEIVSRNDKFDYVMEKAGRYRKCGGSLRKTAGRSLSPRIVTSF